MKIQPLVALDIGATRVACAVGLSHEQAPGFELLGSSLIAYPVHPETWLSDPLMVSQAITQALDVAAPQVACQRALVAINHPALTSEQVRATIAIADEPMTVRGQDLDRLQARAIHQVVGVDREPLLIERLRCDGNGFEGVRDPRGLMATRLTGFFDILTLPVAARCLIVQAAEAAGLEVTQLTHTLPAALASVGNEALSHQRVLLIDVGGLTTSVGLFINGVLHALILLPWGGLTLAHAIAQQLHITMEQAVTWSFEGMACRHAAVHPLIQERWHALQQAMETLLQQQARPETVLVAGRGSLIDGFAEWIERTLGIPTTLCRSPRTSTRGELAYQIGLSSAIGLLEMATRNTLSTSPPSSRLFDRLIDSTRTILAEYF